MNNLTRISRQSPIWPPGNQYSQSSRNPGNYLTQAIEHGVRQHLEYAQGWAAWALTHADLWVRGLQEAFDSMDYHTEEAWEIAREHGMDTTLAPYPRQAWFTYNLLTQVETPILPNTWSVFDP